jgi:GT2 family glycosyltransferase
MVSFCIITNAALSGFRRRESYLRQLLRSIRSLDVPISEYQILICGAVPHGLECDITLNEPELAAEGKVSSMRNLLASRASGDVIVHCDDDIVLGEGYWNSLVRFSGSYSVGILCTRLLNPNGTRYWDWAAYYPSRGQTLLPYAVENDAGTYATGGHLIVKKSIYDGIHWDETLKHGQNEEYAFAHAAKKAGIRIGLDSTATVFLQYHHCDATAVAEGREQERTEVYCIEFVGIQKKCRDYGVARARTEDSSLYNRVSHKLASTLNCNDPAEVSILVGCYRYLQRFRIFARSVIEQDFEGTIELVVADPESPDGLADYLELLQRVTRKSKIRIMRVPLEENYKKNRGYMIQKAFEQSSGNLIIGMDCDLVLPKTFITNIASALDKNGNSVLGVYRNFLGRETTEGILSGIIDPIDTFDNLLSEDCSESQGYRGVLGYCQALLRSSWVKCGGYPIEFNEIARSDVAFVQSLCHAGIAANFLKEVRVLHLHHERDWVGLNCNM